MKSRLPDVPPLKTLAGVVGAAPYNRVRLAFARFGSPQEVVLGTRGLRFRLDREVWLCTDSRLDDAPLVAWSGFEDRQRAGVHVPVRCQVFYYHAYARVIAGNVLTEVERRIEALLVEEREAMPVVRGPRVLPLRRIPEERTIR